MLSAHINVFQHNYINVPQRQTKHNDLVAHLVTYVQTSVYASKLFGSKPQPTDYYRCTCIVCSKKVDSTIHISYIKMIFQIPVRTTKV